MMSRSAIKYIGVLIVALVLGAGMARAQQFPERRHVREGNSLYERQRFADAERSYRKALQKAWQDGSLEADALDTSAARVLTLVFNSATTEGF